MKGICTNWDCPKFDENGKIVQNIPDGEDFVCQKCGKKLQEVSGESGGFGLWIKEHKSLVIIAVAVAVLVAVGVAVFLLSGNDVTPMDKIIVE
jgi:hypothetical protein